MTHFKSPVREYMSAPPVLIGAAASTVDAEALLDRRAITALGVTDTEGRLVGVLSRTDLLRAADAESGATFTVPDAAVERFMTSDPITVSPDSELDAAAKRMLKAHIHRVFVVEDGKPVGVLSTRDVMRAVHEKQVRAPAIEIASTSVAKVRADDPIALAVDRLDRSNRHGLIVTDRAGWPVGTFAQVDALLGRAKDPKTPVEDAMECRILVLPPSTPLYRLAQQALAMNVRRVVLMDRDDLGIRGVVSSFDFCRLVASTMG